MIRSCWARALFTSLLNVMSLMNDGGRWVSSLNVMALIVILARITATTETKRMRQNFLLLTGEKLLFQMEMGSSHAYGFGSFRLISKSSSWSSRIIQRGSRVLGASPPISQYRISAAAFLNRETPPEGSSGNNVSMISFFFCFGISSSALIPVAVATAHVLPSVGASCRTRDAQKATMRTAAHVRRRSQCLKKFRLNPCAPSGCLGAPLVGTTGAAGAWSRDNCEGVATR
mmetsp:Transcript_136559/g.237024  ORF Transcript_136559/g.237024 Transcript_136559/m.237024 type:complete len:230 (+) Transcript_136559:1813-2502(+)